MWWCSQVQRLLAARFDPGWLFSQLFLVKDTYTQQLEAAGMWADALQVGVCFQVSERAVPLFNTQALHAA
jgi:hypothetical protein